MILAGNKARTLNAIVNLSVYENAKLPRVEIRVIHFKYKDKNAGSAVEIAVIRQEITEINTDNDFNIRKRDILDSVDAIAARRLGSGWSTVQTVPRSRQKEPIEMIWDRLTADAPDKRIGAGSKPEPAQDRAMLRRIDEIAVREYKKLKRDEGKNEGLLKSYREQLIKLLLEKLTEKSNETSKEPNDDN